MALPDPPLAEPIAVTEDRLQAGRLPKLVMSKRWLDYFGELGLQVDAKPARKRTINLSAQVAAIGTTPIPIGTVGPGIWRISYVARITTPASVNSSLTVTFSWTTEDGVAQSQSGAAIVGNTTTSVQFGTLILRVKANTPISYATAYVSNIAGMAYSLDIVAEELALD